jgi:hypothetical protein
MRQLTIILVLVLCFALTGAGYSGRSKARLRPSGAPGFLTAGGLPVGMMGQQYQYKFEAIGGTPPYTFTSFSGLAQPSLPAGLTLDADGNLSGIPDTSGQYSAVGFSVTDSNKESTTVLMPMDILTADGVQGVRRMMMSSAKGDNPGPGGGANFFFGDTDGIWTVGSEPNALGQPTGFTILFINPDLSLDSTFSLSLSTRQLGVPFTVGVYDNCQRAAFADPGYPGIDVTVGDEGCDMDYGSFTVNTVSFDPSGNLETLDVTLTQYCESPTAPPLSGHIIYGLAPPAQSANEPTIKTVAYNPKKKDGTLSLTGKNFNSQCSLLIDGHQFVIQTEVDLLKQKVGPALIRASHVALSPGVHQLQVVDLTGQLSPEFALSVR